MIVGKIRRITSSLVLVLLLAGCDLTTSLHSQPFVIAMNNVLSLTNLIPIVIIGSGPAALTAALYCARQNVRTLVITGNKPGGALTETTYIENWPGRAKVLGTDLMRDIQKQAQHFGASVLADAVATISFKKWAFELKTESGKIFSAMAVIIATGSTPRILGVPGEKELWGKGVTTCAICDAPYHKDSDVVVVGGGDSAIEEATQLAAYAKQVTILVRKDHMRAAASMQDRLKEYPQIQILYNVEIQKIVGQDQVVAVEILNTITKKVETVSVTGVFLAIGHEPNTKLFKDQLELDDQGYIVVKGRSQQTSVPGVFAAGDVEDHEYKQAIGAAGSGMRAAIDAVKFLEKNGYNTAIAAQLDKKFDANIVQTTGSLKVSEIMTVHELERIIDQDKEYVVVDFYAPYCPSCMRMLPAVESVAYELKDKVRFVKVDTSKSNELPTKYHVPQVPCLLVFKRGSLIARYNQAMSRKELYDFMMKIVQ